MSSSSCCQRCQVQAGLAAVSTLKDRLQNVLQLRHQHGSHIKAAAHIGNLVRVLHQGCRQLAGRCRCAQRRLPAAGVGHPDVSGDSLLGQLLLLSAAVTARRRLDCTLHLGYDGLLGHAGLVRQPPGVDIPRRGADAPLGQDTDGLADIAEPAVITAQVVLGLRFFSWNSVGLAVPFKSISNRSRPYFLINSSGSLAP